MYNTNQRKIFPLGYKLRFLFAVNESIGINGRDKAQKYWIGKHISSRFTDLCEPRELKEHIMRINDMDVQWQTVS
jgi:hypothetical protein